LANGYCDVDDCGLWAAVAAGQAVAARTATRTALAVERIKGGPEDGEKLSGL
jgi:hypothetical protein